jgi:hypothetical protein
VASLPRQLVDRLDAATGAALAATIDAIGEELEVVYSQTKADHRPARGDNSQVFGLQIWARGDFRITGRLADEPVARVIHSKGSYYVSVEPISVGVYKLGQSVDDDIHELFPDESATKRSYGERNAAQLSLFDCPIESPLPAEHRYELNDLVVAHFGNARDGLVKWYVGAVVSDGGNRPAWAWIERQDLPGEVVEPVPQTPPIVPYSSRDVPNLEVKPRRRSTGT